MNKTLTLILREYLVVVRKKTFLVMTFLLPLLFGGIILLQTYLAQRDRALSFAVVDRSDLRVAQKLTLDRNNPFDILVKQQIPYEFHWIPDTPEAVAAAREKTKAKGEGSYQALIIIPADIRKQGQVEYISKSITDFQVQEWLRNALTRIVRDQRMADKGLTRAEVRAINASVSLKLEDVTGKEGGAFQRFVIGFGSMFLLYMMIAIYGQAIVTGMIEDKNSKIIEVLLSSVRANQVLLGKVVGIGLTSLTQVGIWAVAALVTYYVRPETFGLWAYGASLKSVGFTLLYFLLGYAIFALLLGAVGAMAPSVQDAQQLTLPIFLPIILAMATFPAVMREPDGVLALVMSIFPLTSPIVMPALMGVATVPVWQVAASLGVLAGSVPLVYVACAKLFRLMILTQGNVPKMKEIWSLLRTRES